MPDLDIERILDLLISKDFVYDLSKGRLWNARRYSSITVACVRHWYSDYDELLREGVERFEARARTGEGVWRVLKEWCPWESSNEVLRRCFEASLVRPEERGEEWVDDPMDLDLDEEVGGLWGGVQQGQGQQQQQQQVDFEDDPMDLD